MTSDDARESIEAQVNAAVQRALRTSETRHQPTETARDLVAKLDIEPIFKVFRDLVNPQTQCPDPQIYVVCRGERRAFGRKSLKAMGYNRALNLFVERFARKDDWVEPASSGWLSSRTPPTVTMFASFYYGATASAPAVQSTPRPSVILDPTGWEDCIGNVMELEIYLERQGSSARQPTYESV